MKGRISQIKNYTDSDFLESPKEVEKRNINIDATAAIIRQLQLHCKSQNLRIVDIDWDEYNGTRTSFKVREIPDYLFGLWIGQ